MRLRIALLLLSIAPPAQAAGPIAEVLCAPRAAMIERLRGQMHSAPAGMGMRDTETVVEIWSSSRGDWQLVQHYTDGTSCILAMGAGWETIPPQDPA